MVYIIMIVGYILFLKLYSYFCNFIFGIFLDIPLNMQSILELIGMVVIGVPLVAFITHLFVQLIDRVIKKKWIKNIAYISTILILIVIIILISLLQETKKDSF